MKYQLLLLAALIINKIACQTLWTDAGAYWIQLPQVREGSFESLFINATVDPNNTCWTSFTTLQTQISNLPSITKFAQLTTVFNTIKVYITGLSYFFNFYSSCNLDSINIQLGKQLSTVSGFIDLCIGTLFTYLNEVGDSTWQNNLIALINQANMSGSDADWRAVGAPLGLLVANYFNYQIPTYNMSYGSFTASLGL